MIAPRRQRARRRRWPSGCGRARSTSSSGRRSCSRRASRCAKRSSATCCSRSSCGARRAPARRRWRASSPTRRRRGSSRSARCSPGIKEIRDVMAEAERIAPTDRPPHDRLHRRDPPLQQGAAGRVPAARRGRRHRADRRDDREPVVRGQRGAAVALEGVRAARPRPPTRSPAILERALADPSAASAASAVDDRRRTRCARSRSTRTATRGRR